MSSSLLYSEGPTNSRTHQYRKVMKPLLERKRRARINKSLDEIKELLKDVLTAESGDSLNKLEKADILELTVKHLRKTSQTSTTTVDDSGALDPFFSGYSACASHTSQFLSALPGVGHLAFTSDLLSHLRTHLGTSGIPPSYSEPRKPSADSGLIIPGSLTPPPDHHHRQIKTEFVWRPF